ncbi:unnamed protein product [Caenorhabditis nigoni]
MLPVPRHQPDKKRRDDTKKVYDKLRRWYGIPHATKVKLLLTIASDFKISKNKIIIDPKFGADKQVTVVLEPLANHIRGEIGFEIDLSTKLKKLENILLFLKRGKISTRERDEKLFCPRPERPVGHHAKKKYDQQRRDKLNTLFLEIKREIKQRVPELKRSPSKYEILHYLINRFSGEKCWQCEAIQVQSTKEKDKIKDIEERTTNNCLWDRLERAQFGVPREKIPHETVLEVALTSLRLLQDPKREGQAIGADEIEDDEVEVEIERDDSEEEYEDFGHNHYQRAPRGNRMEDEREQNHYNRHVMEHDMESVEGEYREPASPRNNLVDNGYVMKMYFGDEMEVDHVEEIETTIVADKDVAMISDIVDEDEIKKEGEGIDEEIQENDQKRNIGSDGTEQNDLVEIKDEFMDEVEEIKMKFDEMEASEGPSHIDEEMEDIGIEEEVKVNIGEEAIEDLGNERVEVVQNFEEEEMEKVEELVEDKEDHTGSTLKEELTIAVQAVPFVEILQKRGLCCGNFVEKEELVKCDQCEQFYHETCREMGWGPTGECKCRRPEFLGTKYTSSQLPTDRMSEKLTDAIKDLVPDRYFEQLEIRVIANEMRNGTIGERLAAFCEKNNIAVPQHKYHYKMILVFLKPVEGQDEEKGEALIFAYTVHEFGAGEETTPKSKWTVLGYLDSNRYITDGTKRHLIFQGIVLSYLKYAASAGYEFCHFWCAAPDNDYYLFNDPMVNGAPRPDQIRLREWYSKVLKSGKAHKIIESWDRERKASKDMDLEQLLENFHLDGGYWPKRIEKMLEKEMKPEKLRELLVTEISNKSDAFFVDFRAPKTAVIQDSTPVIPTMDMTRSKEDFLAVQVENGLRYSTNRLLWYSTARTIQLLMKGSEQNEKQQALPSSSS